MRQPELKDILVEASHALANLDADRLEEMTLSCAALVRAVDSESVDAKDQLDSECREAWKEMAIFMRVLDATKANLSVMHRLREIRAAQLEYGREPVGSHVAAGSDHGDH
jgi:hypothetical protein